MANRLSFSSISKSLFQFFSGFGLAVTCLLLLFILTWLSTLEQPAKGLYEVQKRYYDAEALYVIPDLPLLNIPDKPWLPIIGGKKLIIPLPGAYLVSAVLFVNLFLGGLVRIRKGWKYSGVIISHFSMVSLLVAGFVSHHYSKEGIMFVLQGQKSNYAQSYTDYTIEVAEIVNGEKSKPYVVPAEPLKALDPERELKVSLPDLPFDLVVSNWLRNSEMGRSSDKSDPQVVDGVVLAWKKLSTTEEENAAGCLVDVVSKKSGKVVQRLLLYGPNIDMITASVDGKVYGFDLVREIWPMPFRVQLDESVGEYYPGTRKPSFFQSKITRIADDGQKKFTIRMNEPMRYGGYTLYQARWSGETEVPQSGFAIVKNPSDQWPKWSLYISILGLTIHFVMKLFGFIGRKERKQVTAA